MVGGSRSTAPRTGRTLLSGRGPLLELHRGCIPRPRGGVGSDKQSRQERLLRAQMFALFGKVNTRAAKLGRI